MLQVLKSAVTEDCSTDIRLFAKVRDEKPRLAYFLDYYRKLGVGRFYVIDNGSTDGTVEFLMDQKDVCIYSTTESLSSHAFWLQELLMLYGLERWCLVVDADELFVYPFMDRVNLKALSDFLLRKSFTAVQLVLVDMYGENNMDKSLLVAGENPLDLCPYFDSKSYNSTLKRIGPQLSGLEVTGGPRVRVFSCGAYLLKTPFFFFADDMVIESGAHNVSNAVTYVFGALLHFKFLSTLVEKTEAATREKQYWNESSEYEKYQSVFEKTADLKLYYTGSKRYRNWGSLVVTKLMRVPISYIWFVIKHQFRRKTISQN